METLYTGHIHGFTSSPANISYGTVGSAWGSQGGLVALGVVLGSSVSLVGLAFAFITYSLFSDLRSLAGTTLLSLLASLFMGQLLFVIGVGGIQDQELCLSLSLALLYMKLASLCWLCCCCHQTLSVFRNNVNLISTPEQKMGRRLAHYSILSWGFPFAMVGVAAAFKYKEKTWKVTGGSQVFAQIVREVQKSTHCWLMEGSAFIWGFLIPAIVLLLLGAWLAAQGSGAAKISAGLQIDAKARNKMMRKRGLQIGLFIRLLILIAIIVFLGGLASLWNTPELWAIYSIGQGVQGIVTAMLVTCNCRILKLYTSTGSKSRKGIYKSLRECEGGRYGVLSVTNPNYQDDVETQHYISNQITKLSPSIHDDTSNFIRMGYREDIFAERNDLKSRMSESNSINMVLSGELSGCLKLDEILKDPPIESV